ncbi:MAG TPA: peptidoglycan-binding domain-containing protein [Candidatus Paceibacterota bacterium]|nr:peptidoglycan-binding domain-containing protein [Candidatus Paceibacterota bacterium]
MSTRKFFAGIVALVAVFAVASTVSAQTAAYTFTSDLTIGSTGADVVALQSFLESKGHLVIPAGTTKGYFGSLTQSALAKFQSANGISPAAGYFGPVTRAAVNSMNVGGTGATNPCPAGFVSGTFNGVKVCLMGTGTSTPGNGGPLAGGDGDFSDFDVLGNPNDEDVEEGEEVEVLAFEFDADDSDLMIERVDVLFTEAASNTRPWRVLDEVKLLNDGEEVATIDASDEDSWSEEEDDEYKLRFEDLDEVVREDETGTFSIAVVAQDDLDDDEVDLEWDVFLDEDGIRAMNADGIDVYEGDSADLAGASDERTFTLETAEEGDFSVTVDDEENEDEQMEVSEDDDTTEVQIYVAQLESEAGDNMIEEVTVDLSTTTGTVNGLSDFLIRATLWIDGEDVGSESVSDDDGLESITFDDLDVTIAEDEEVDLIVTVDVDSQDGNFTNGAGVYVDGISIDFVDENDDDQTETSTTNGGNVTFSVDALTVEAADNQPSADESLADDETKGRVYVRFTVTAPEESDIYIPKGATTSTTVGSGQGAEFIVVDGSGATVTATTTTGNNILRRVSGGSETGNYYRITQGNSAVLELDVILDNTGFTGARTLGVQLTGLNYNAVSAATADTQFTAGLDEDFRSDTVYLLIANAS